MSAPNTSSGRASGMALTCSARPARIRVGRSRWRAPFRPPTLWWIGSAAACAVRKVMKARPGGQTRDKASGRSLIRVGFSPAQCQPCPSRSRCTQGISRWLGLRPRPEHEALAAARARLESEAGRQLYAQRQGVESTLSQGVRAFGLRQARYRGLAKTGLQNVATAAALNLDRLTAWLAQRPLAPTRISRFAALTA